MQGVVQVLVDRMTGSYKPWKCACGITLGIDNAGFEFHDLDDSKYAPLFRSLSIPPAYMYEEGQSMPMYELRGMSIEDFAALIAKELDVPHEFDDCAGMIISNGWTWRYLHATKVKEINQHVEECRASKRRKDEIAVCTSNIPGHNVISKWVYEDDAIQHKHACACGHEWSERIE